MSTQAEIFDIEALIHPDCRREIASIIAANGGNEVFFIGKTDDAGRVAEVEAYAFGNDEAVPAVVHQAQYGDVVIHNHPSGDLEPSSADIAVASTLGDAGVASYIVDNECERVRVIVRWFRPRTIEPLDVEEIGRTLGPDGILARAIEDYEYRPQQIEMARAVATAFNEEKIAVIEAGTGVGKSMAYLLPAIEWALKNRQRVVVSTNTINLQEQLVRKDIPALQRYSQLRFRSVLVKGRQNYACLRRVHFLRGETAQPEFESFRSELREIIEWALETEDGSLADLAARPSDEVWDLVKVEAESCPRARCPYYQKCFFYEARRAASKAHIVVCNHHILMADLVLRLQTHNYTASAILPPFQRLIIDEAHNLEDVATDYLGMHVTRGGMLRMLGRLYSAKSGGVAKGVLATVLRKLATASASKTGAALTGAIRHIEHNLIPMINEMRHLVEQECSGVFEEAIEYLDRAQLEPGEETALRITPSVESHYFYETLAESVKTLSAGFASMGHGLSDLAGNLGELRKSLGEKASWLQLEVEAQRDKALALAADLAAFLSDKEGVARWIELRRTQRGQILRFRTAPVEVGPGLRRTLFEPCPTVVLTSATLTVDRKFDYMLDRLGLAPKTERPPAAKRFPPYEEVPEIQLDAADDGGEARIGRRLVTVALDTPFDFDRQALVAVPTDIADPTDREFARRIEPLILKSVAITRGRAFVLFTSYTLLERLYEALRAKIESLGCTPLKQGSENRHFLLNRFRNERAPVLFATSSFWEGVDVKGEALVCLILTRLPFRVPTDPIVQARVEFLERCDRDAFEEYTVPQAVIKFKQGFGRLIRHKEDRGAILIFDKRVATRRYGKTFLRSLPTRRIIQRTSEEIFEAMREFFAADRKTRE